MAEDSDSLRSEDADQRWRRALERQPELRKLTGASKRSRDDVQAAADRLGLHASTLYRLLRRFAVDQTAEAITGEPRGWRPGRSRLPASIETLIDAAIRDFFLTKQAPSPAALHREIELRCRAAGLATPAVSTVRRRLRKLSRKAIAGRREGRQAAEAQTMRPGALLVDRPNALWQIDHSPADVVIVDVETRAPIGRPWITLVIDVASRAIAGLHVSLEDPSVTSVGMALRHAILDKTRPKPCESAASRRIGQGSACRTASTATTVPIFAARRSSVLAPIWASRPTIGRWARRATAAISNA